MTRRLICGVAALTLLTTLLPVRAQETSKPVRVAIAGLVHGHVTGFMRRIQGRGSDIELVGVFEPDAALRKAFRERYELAEDQMFASLGGCSQRVKPEAVAAFSTRTTIARSSRRRRRARPRDDGEAAGGAVNGRARHRSAPRRTGGIHVIVNYETTWYPSHRRHLVARQGAEGRRRIRKMVAMDGHEGPKEINVQPEFLAWLSDPVQNGGGALFDFGCYGANLMTWLMDDQRPIAVTAMTQHFKPAIYPEGRRRGDDPRRVSRRAGHHPGVVELAVRPQGLRGLRRARPRDRDRRQQSSDCPAERARTRRHARSASAR